MTSLLLAFTLGSAGIPLPLEAAVAFLKSKAAQERAMAICVETEIRPDAASLCALWMSAA